MLCLKRPVASLISTFALFRPKVIVGAFNATGSLLGNASNKPSSNPNLTNCVKIPTSTIESNNTYR